MIGGDMKKILVFCSAILILTAGPVFSQESSFSFNLGMDFFNYRETFINMGGAYNIGIGSGMEASLGMDFAIWPYRQGEEIKPAFFIPINLGFNFIFLEMYPRLLLGVGVSPIIIVRPEGGPTEELGRTGFYMGPYVRAGIRWPIHKVMSWFALIHQDLSIGPPNWINTGTRITTGINFALGVSEDEKAGY